MDELISQVSQKTGLPPAQARMAAETVLNFIKSKVPALAGHIDSIVGGEGATAGASGQSSGGIGDVTKSLGSMLGR